MAPDLSVLSRPWPAADLAGEGALLEALDAHLGVQIPGVLSAEACAALARGVLAARAHWVDDFEGEQFTLGRAWYTHLEQGRSRDYFAGAQASDELVERWAPGLQGRVLAALSELLGSAVQRRPGWCGPGVHIFPAGEWVSIHGGVIHSDMEGLSEAHIEDDERALSAILMLQPPEQGGGLALWGEFHGVAEEIDPDDVAEVPRVVVPYAVGDLLLIDSYRIHQIQPFLGRLDRISLTAHVARLPDGRWESWF
jgi:hypothetical protein